MKKYVLIFFTSILSFAQQGIQIVRSYNTISEVLQINPVGLPSTIHVLGILSTNDFGGGAFQVIRNATSSTNTYGVFRFANNASWSLRRITPRIYFHPDFQIFDSEGSGSPEGVIIGNIGSTYRRRDGTANQIFYVKESGNGTAFGWIPYGQGGGGGGGGNIESLNGLTAANQAFEEGEAGTDFQIISSGSTHIFNLPFASATANGKVSSTSFLDWNSRQPGNILLTNFSTLNSSTGFVFQTSPTAFDKKNLSVDPPLYLDSSYNTKLIITNLTQQTSANILSNRFLIFDDTTGTYKWLYITAIQYADTNDFQYDPVTFKLQIRDGINLRVGRIETADGTEKITFEPASGPKTNTTFVVFGSFSDLYFDKDYTQTNQNIVPKINFQSNNTTIGIQRSLNVFAGTNMYLMMTNDTANNRVNLHINSTASGGSTSLEGLQTGSSILTNLTLLNSDIGLMVHDGDTNFSKTYFEAEPPLLIIPPDGYGGPMSTRIDITNLTENTLVNVTSNMVMQFDVNGGGLWQRSWIYNWDILNTNYLKFNATSKKIELVNTNSGGLTGHTNFIDLRVMSSRPPKTGSSADTYGFDAVDKILCDASLDEYVVWFFNWPEDYASGAQIVFEYAMLSATANDVASEAYVWRINTGSNINTESYDTANQIIHTVPGTAGLSQKQSITLNTTDGVQNGDYCAVKFGRKGTLVADNAVSNAEYFNVRFRYIRQ